MTWSSADSFWGRNELYLNDFFWHFGEGRLEREADGRTSHYLETKSSFIRPCAC
jgi:hypothetical protein